jgi:Trypsin-like peptidase domain/Effector-associated domain 1
VLDAVDTNLASISPPGPLDSTAFDLVQWADAQGLLGDLVEAAYASRPRNMEIREVAEALGVTATVDSDTLSRVRPINFPRDEWLSTLNRIEHQICWISCGRAKGTGWLIGPDLLVTARSLVVELIDGTADSHVLEAIFAAFPNRDLRSRREPPARLADDWLVAGSSASEFAILRLRDRLGLRPALPGAYGFRQWISLRRHAVPAQGATVVIPFRPGTGRREISISPGAIKVVEAHAMTYRRAGDDAAIGAPVFNSDWELLALRVPTTARWPLAGASDSRAIPIGDIVDYLDAHGLGPLIDKEFPAT